MISDPGKELLMYFVPCLRSVCCIVHLTIVVSLSFVSFLRLPSHYIESALPLGLLLGSSQSNIMRNSNKKMFPEILTHTVQTSTNESFLRVPP